MESKLKDLALERLHRLDKWKHQLMASLEAAPLLGLVPRGGSQWELESVVGRNDPQGRSSYVPIHIGSLGTSSKAEVATSIALLRGIHLIKNAFFGAHVCSMF